MEIINNFDLMEELLTFTSSDDFYFLQIIQRKKDGNVTGKGNNGTRLIKAYYIQSLEHLEEKKDKIIELCENNNARAYISVNKRSFQKISCECISRLATLISENNCNHATRIWDHACGTTPAEAGSKLLRLLDVDTKDKWTLLEVCNIIKECRGQIPPQERIKTIIPTLNGYHILTSKFDIEQFGQKLALRNMDSIAVQRDGYTLLYYKDREDTFQ